MIEANILNGWRHTDEKPIDGAVLLVVVRDKEGYEYVTIRRKGLKPLERNPLYKALAWQYVPEWKKEDQQ